MEESKTTLKAKGTINATLGAGKINMYNFDWMEPWYEGIDLTEKFADEIKDYPNVWEWIKARIKDGNYSGLHVADYIPFDTIDPLDHSDTVTFHARIAGINTYKQYGSGSFADRIDNHIDFITKELWGAPLQMNLVNMNNGTSAQKWNPWIASNGYLYVNSLAGQVANSVAKPFEMVDVDYTTDGIYYYLPEDLKNVIIPKKLYVVNRWDTDKLLDENVIGMADCISIGNLWLPDGFEIFGTSLCSAAPNEWDILSVQYPLFAHNMRRLFTYSKPYYDWVLGHCATISPANNSTVEFMSANRQGVNLIFNPTKKDVYAPICFRIGFNGVNP